MKKFGPTALETQLLTALKSGHGPGRKAWNGGWSYQNLCDYLGGGKCEVAAALKRLLKAEHIRAYYVDGPEANSIDNCGLGIWRFYPWDYKWTTVMNPNPNSRDHGEPA